jgi:hypothetical protein
VEVRFHAFHNSAVGDSEGHIGTNVRQEHIFQTVSCAIVTMETDMYRRCRRTCCLIIRAQDTYRIILLLPHLEQRTRRHVPLTCQLPWSCGGDTRFLLNVRI